MTKKTFFSLFMATIAALAAFAPELALADGGALDELGNKLCDIVATLTGNIGVAIATIAIVFLGIGAFFGKVNWGLCVIVSAGIIAIFGAASIVGSLDDGGEGTCTGSGA